jgi:hypothetical protein
MREAGIKLSRKDKMSTYINEGQEIIHECFRDERLGAQYRSTMKDGGLWRREDERIMVEKIRG